MWNGKEEKYKNLNISRNKRVFRWNKKIFFVASEGLSFGEKVKNSGQDLNSKT